MVQKTKWLCILLLVVWSCSNPRPQEPHNSPKLEIQDWKQEVKKNLEVFGHRNWIVVADAAYPQQSNAAITTLKIDAGQLETVAFVHRMIQKYEHVDATIFVDKEMAFVSENAAKGIDSYRTELHNLLEGSSTNLLLHEDIIRKLDDSAKLFKVLVLKTNSKLPYTSVFYQLECGYWNAASEGKLRNDMSNE